MNIIKANIDQIAIIEPQIHSDSRGYFFESFNQKEFEEKVCKTTFVQDNESKSSYGVLRGLHFQDRKSTRLNSSHKHRSRMPSSA